MSPPRWVHDDACRLLESRILVCPFEPHSTDPIVIISAAMAYPENPRDAEDRVLCPICKRPFDESEPTSKGGAFVYHRTCWRRGTDDSS